MKRFSFHDLKLGKKLFLIFGTSVLFVGALIFVGLYNMVWMKSSTAIIYEETMVEAHKLINLKVNMEESRRALLSAILEPEPGKKGEHLAAARAASDLVDTDLSAILEDEKFEEEIKPELTRLKAVWEDFKRAREKDVLPRLERRPREAVTIIMGEQEKRFRNIIAINNALIEHERLEAEVAQEDVHEAIERTIFWYFLISIAGAAVAVVLLLVFIRNFVKRLGSLMDGVNKFRDGELRIKLNDEGLDEIGILAGCLNSMFRRLYEDKIANSQYLEIMEWEAIQREKQSEALLRSEERFRGLVETSKDMVWEIDRNGVFTYVSPRITDILGYLPDETVGRSPLELMPTEEAARMEEVKNFHLETESAFAGLEIVHLHKDGRRVIFENSGAPYHDSHGVFQGFRGIGRDITRRKMAEEEKKRMQAQLVQSEKMASVGQLAAGVAHEINNPVGFVSSNLNTLGVYIQGMKDLFDSYKSLESAPAEERGSMLNEIERIKDRMDFEYALKDVINLLSESRDGLERIKSIVKGLKEFSHAGSEVMERCDVNACLENAVKLAWHEMKYKANLNKDLGLLPMVDGRPQQLTQVFLNMLVNAAHAIPEKGEIGVATWADDKTAVIQIRDTGEGMPEEVRKRIFEPFFTTKPVGKGTGIGLSIAYGIIKDHKGNIIVESEKGKGTVFTIRIPLKACESPDAR